MCLKKFNEYSQGLTSDKKVNNIKKVNEASFLVGDEYKVKTTFDVSKQLVTQYIEKVIEETGRNPLDNFNEAEVAEQMIDYIVKKNMIIDNLPSDFTVGSEDSSKLENSVEKAEADSEELSDDMGDSPDEEINIDSSDDGETGDIEFGLEEDDIDEEIEVDESESDDGFEEIEFDSEYDSDSESDSDSDSESNSDEVKTVGDYLKKLNGSPIEDKNTSTEEDISGEEEENVEDLYKKIGYKTGYFESLNLNTLFKR